MANAIRLNGSLYRVLLFAYPRDFRLRFETEMATTFLEQVRSGNDCDGFLGIARVWLVAVVELFSVAVPLQLRSRILIAMFLSFLWSFALFIAFFRATTS